MKINETIELLGKKAKDKITGREGIVSSVSFDLYGCITAILTPPVQADGKFGEQMWIDVSRLTITDHQRVMDVPKFEVTAPSPRAEVSGADSGKPLP